MKPLSSCDCLGFFRRLTVLFWLISGCGVSFSAERPAAEGFVLNQPYACEEIGAYTGGAGTSGGFSLTIENYTAATGKFTGRLTFTSYGQAVSRIEGTLGKGMISFKEVAWIKEPNQKGRLFLGGVYNLQLGKDGFYTGGWTLGNKSGKIRIKAPEVVPPIKIPSLTGAWVYSADPRAVVPDSRVIIVQEGDNVRLTHSYKVDGKWVTLVGEGKLVGNRLSMVAKWAPGGNPHGYANGTIDVTVSADGNHLDGKGAPHAVESHYSRCP